MVRWRKEAAFQRWWAAEKDRPHYDRCIAGEDIGDHTWWCCLRANMLAKESFARRAFSRRHRLKRWGSCPGDIDHLRRRYARQRKGRW